MNPGVLEAIARVEAGHWWYRGLRSVLGRCLARPDLAPPPRPRVLDAGCGTGENLRFLRELLAPSYLGGFDLAEEAVALARRRLPGADVYRGDLCDPELHETDLDLVISMDVLYIPGVERARAGLARLAGALRPGGLLALNLPAYDWLYSEHDVAIHTTQRFTARQVRALFADLGLRVEVLTYRLCLLFPAVVLSRLPRKLGARRGDATARSDLDRPPGELVNRALFQAVELENRLIARGVRLPWGSSVFAIGRKP